MAVEKVDPHDEWTVEAGEDLSEHQFAVVKIEEGKLKLAAEKNRGFILRDAPAAGVKGTIAVPGPIVKALASGTVTAGELLVCTGEGKVANLALLTEHAVIGTALTSGASGDLVTLTLHPAGVVS